jgi:hypothetical protein
MHAPARHWRFFSPGHPYSAPYLTARWGPKTHWLSCPTGQPVRAARGCGAARCHVRGAFKYGGNGEHWLLQGSKCLWVGEALKVGTQRDALWQRKLCGHAVAASGFGTGRLATWMEIRNQAIIFIVMIVICAGSTPTFFLSPSTRISGRRI